MLKNLLKAQEDAGFEFTKAKCNSCSKLKDAIFKVFGKKKIPVWHYCSIDCIQKDLAVTRAKDWAALTNSKKKLDKENTGI